MKVSNNRICFQLIAILRQAENHRHVLYVPTQNVITIYFRLLQSQNIKLIAININYLMFVSA